MLICHSCCHEGSAGPLSIYVLLKSNLHALDETKKETELRIRLDSSRFIALETQSQNLQYTVPFQLSWAKVWAMVWWADRGHDMIKQHPGPDADTLATPRGLETTKCQPEMRKYLPSGRPGEYKTCFPEWCFFLGPFNFFEPPDAARDLCAAGSQ